MYFGTSLLKEGSDGERDEPNGRKRARRGVTGPWPAPEVVYTPPESSQPGVLVYAAKAHPELSGADLVLTYASNDSDFGTLVSDLSLYFPRFVRLTYARGGP